MSMTNKQVREELNRIAHEKYGKSYHALKDSEADAVRKLAARRVTRPRTPKQARKEHWLAETGNLW